MSSVTLSLAELFEGSPLTMPSLQRHKSLAIVGDLVITVTPNTYVPNKSSKNGKETHRNYIKSVSIQGVTPSLGNTIFFQVLRVPRLAKAEGESIFFPRYHRSEFASDHPDFRDDSDADAVWTFRAADVDAFRAALKQVVDDIKQIAALHYTK
jgi:hypothetical protein